MKTIDSNVNRRTGIDKGESGNKKGGIVDEDGVTYTGREDLIFVVQLPVRVGLIFLFFLLQFFGELAFTITMQQGPVFVLAGGFGNIILVPVEIKHDKSPVKGLGCKEEEKEYGCQLFKHTVPSECPAKLGVPPIR